MGGNLLEKGVQKYKICLLEKFQQEVYSKWFSCVGMALFLKNTSFHGVHLDRLMDAGNPDWPTVTQLMKDGIASGVVRPLKATTFHREEVEGAFRFMAQGKHIGKVLIQVRPLTCSL